MTHDTSSLQLEREGSVPVSGFSRELRSAPDVERFRFAFALSGEAPSPVHVVYSPSQRVAEVKMGDLKAFRLSEVASVEEARERWVAWWRERSHRHRFVAPQRAGRHPSLVSPRS
jgi:hypothetical protein